MTMAEIIADALFEHLPLRRNNPRHPTIMAAAGTIAAALAKAAQAEATAKVRGDAQ